MNSRRGLFVVIDGPSGVGKSTTIRLLADQLAATGRPSQATREPSDSPIGALARDGTHDYDALTLACLVAADRYHHLATTIRPALHAGRIVVCDRYLPASLVLQTFDGVPEDTVWNLNTHIDRPDLTVILLGAADVCRQRAAQRGTYSRFHQHLPDEPARYAAITAGLAAAGHHTVTYDIGEQTPDQVADGLLEHVLRLYVAHTEAAARDTTSS